MIVRKEFVTKEQIDEARRPDLLSYLRQYESDELMHISGEIYCTRTHDSLKISNGKWFWWSRGIGGRSALDYLVKVRNMGFVDAVEHLCNQKHYVEKCVDCFVKPKPKPPFILPTRYMNSKRVIGYLLARGISQQLIQACLNNNMIYEETEHHNCCFVGFDKNGKAQYAMCRSSMPKSTFMQEVSGSNKEYSFQLPINSNSDTLYVFESAIDLLSFATQRQGNNEDVMNGNYLSLSGVYQPLKKVLETPLPAALSRFLKQNQHIRHISLRLDNDTAGILAARTIQALLKDKYEVTYVPPIIGKDYNEQLMRQKGLAGVKTRQSKTHNTEVSR